jgi:beta-lactamase superfamily II metal-dependent hydrolase
MGTKTIRVRMYAVGFGDCFLIGFPGADREHLVLVDCGVHSASRGGADLADVISDIVAEATKATGAPLLDVVMASHRHRDHVHGFRYEGWDTVEVREVWLPWTEDPNDAEARGIRERQSKRAKHLGVLAADLGGPWAAVRAISENNDGFTNAAAMTTLHQGFKGAPPRFFLPEKAGKARARRFRTEVLPGVETYVLGPARDEAAIRDMDPPAGQSYLRLGTQLDVSPGGGTLPFERDLISQADYARLYPDLAMSRSAVGSIVNAGKVDALGLATSLEQAVNGTSLMLLFVYGGTSLLFAGDAQWGTWDRVMNDPEGRELLAGINMYKVGHHGSHNATPKRFVEDILVHADASVVSVGSTSIPSWGDIPRKPLLRALATKSRTISRSDELRKAARRKPPDAPPADAAIQEDPDGLWTEFTWPIT